MTKEQILNEVKALDPEQQTELAEDIWLNAHGLTPEQIDKAWAAEVRRRLDEVQRGDVSTRPATELAERLLNKPRQ
jgi:putative addiction module component (TIGR02574 family)